MNKLDVLTHIRENGIYQGSISKSVTDTLYQKYFIDIEQTGVFKKNYNQYFKKITVYDDLIKSIFIDNIIDIISEYHHEEIFVRDIYAVSTLPYQTENIKNLRGHASKWHTDLNKSFALMLLVNDITINDSHMEFIPSQKYESITILQDLQITQPNNIQSCIGTAGTYFLFNNGQYLHRGKLLNQNKRLTLHAIYLTKQR